MHLKKIETNRTEIMEKAPDKCYVGNENVFCTKKCRKKKFLHKKKY